MVDAITSFFSSDSFIPHGHCFLWTPSILYTWVISDIAIFLSYSAIPMALLYIMRKRADIPYNGLVFLFAAFILFCGVTHAMGAWTIWHPQYGLASALKAITALVSVATAVVLWPLAPTLIAIPSPSDLQDANDSLEKTTGQLRMANQNLEQFATMAAHDLRAPLKSIINLADLAMLEPANQQNQPLLQIREMADKMEPLIAGYRRLSHIRLDEGTMETRQISDFVHSAQQETGAKLVVNQEGDARVKADNILFTQLFVNLLNNAQQYGSRPEVLIRCAQDDDQSVTIEVSNPIEQSLKVDEKVFAPFRRLTKHGDGMGLGLAICDRIVQLHGGTIRAEAVDSRFSISFSVRCEPETVSLS